VFDVTPHTNVTFILKCVITGNIKLLMLLQKSCSFDFQFEYQ